MDSLKDCQILVSCVVQFYVSGLACIFHITAMLANLMREDIDIRGVLTNLRVRPLGFCHILFKPSIVPVCSASRTKL